MLTVKNPFFAGTITGFVAGVVVASLLSNNLLDLIRTCAEAIALIVPKEQGLLAIAFLSIPVLCYAMLRGCLQFLKEARDNKS